VPHIYIFSCIHHKIQIQDLFYQRSLRVVNSDTDPPGPSGQISGGGPDPLNPLMDAPMREREREREREGESLQQI